MTKRDGGKDLLAYVTATRKAGAKLVASEIPRTVRDERRQRAGRKLAAKKSSN
jgi:hypothetical protein